MKIDVNFSADEKGFVLHDEIAAVIARCGWHPITNFGALFLSKDLHTGIGVKKAKISFQYIGSAALKLSAACINQGSNILEGCTATLPTVGSNEEYSARLSDFLESVDQVLGKFDAVEEVF